MRVLNSGKCYDATINPGISVEFAGALRDMHSFLAETIFSYDASNFLVPNGLRGKKGFQTDLSDAIENLSFYRESKCAVTHGGKTLNSSVNNFSKVSIFFYKAMDGTWNIAGNGDNVESINFLKFIEKLILKCQ